MEGSQVIGREAELREIDGMLAAASEAPASILIAGEAGIGKSTLWEVGIERAEHEGFAILRSRPAESERSLSFAGLRDLLVAVQPDVDLPEPQRYALAIAMRDAAPEGPPPDRLAVSVALSTVIARLAARGPVLMAVDDAQWIDRSTADAIAYALRRLRRGPVGVLVAVRGSADAMAFGLDRVPGTALRRIHVGPMSMSELFRLVQERVGIAVSRPTLARLEAASGGNPFFALELARALVLSDGATEPDGELPVPGSLRALVDDRLALLPEDTLHVLGVAAQSIDARVDVVERAAGLNVRASLALAAEADVARVRDGAIEFVHPLLAAGVIARLDEDERRAIHRRLAVVAADSEARALHLARAGAGPDEHVASLLDEAAAAARDRGAPAAAMELWALAVAATPPEDPTARLGRRRELAAAAFTVGDVERAGSMLDELLADAPDGPERARILLSLAKVRFEQRSATEAVELCDEAAAHANEDPSMRARILALATQVCDFDMERRAGYARAAWDAIRRDDDPDPASVAEILTALALVELCLGHGLREDLIRRAIEIEARRPPVIVSVRAACNLADWYVRCDRYADARPLMEADLVACRDGDEGSLCQVLVDVARLDIVTGHWSVAEDELREALEMAEGDGQPTKIVEVLALLAPLEAVTGRAALAEEHVVTADATAIDLGDPVALVLANVGAGSVAFHLGDPAVAVSRLSAADREDEREHLREPGFRPYMGDLIEARVELGQPAEALEALERLEAMARSVDRASGLAAAARCRALLTARADVDVALGWCARARAEHDRVGDPFQMGRTVLVEGRIRRRHRQKLAAREVLKEAQAIFDGLGASAWSARAQAELDRTGRRLDEPTALTGTERRVAELVASGLSNREVAGLMFISSRTVEANLTRIYRKLQVPSRAALGRRLAELESD